jgi:hypothetical protein
MNILLSAVLTVALVEAQSNSELLQRGIYLQETMGDLDGAIKIYKQIAQTAQESRGLAAQAQFRLGLCLDKKGQPAEAARVLQKLITDYPEQTDLVARAKALLPSGPKLLPAPWIDGEILDLAANMGNSSLPAGAVKMRFAVESSKAHPGNWLFENRIYNSASMFTIQVEADRETLRPARMVTLGYHPVLGDSQTTYQGDEVRAEVKGKEPKTFKMEGPVFDSNEIVAVLRRLPLAAGYKTSLQIFAAGTEAAPMRIAVTAEEEVKTPAGVFHAYKVEVNQGQTYWISTDPSRYLVKLEEGTMMTAFLFAIGRSDQPSGYRNEKLGIFLNLPAGWTAEDNAGFDPKKETVQLLDSGSQALVTVTVEPRKLTTPPTAAGMRTEAERNFKQPQFPAQTLRPDTWQTRQVDGHPALSWIADSSNMFVGSTPVVLYTTWVRSDSQKAVISAMVDPKEFEAFRQRFDRIIDTFTLR